MKVELLWFSGCPNWRGTDGRLREALAAAGTDAEVAQVEVTTPEDARAAPVPRFPDGPRRRQRPVRRRDGAGRAVVPGLRSGSAEPMACMGHDGLMLRMASAAEIERLDALPVAVMEEQWLRPSVCRRA